MARKRRTQFLQEESDFMKQTTLDCFFKIQSKITTEFTEDTNLVNIKKKVAHTRTINKKRKSKRVIPIPETDDNTDVSEESQSEIIVEPRKLPFPFDSSDSEDVPFKLCYQKHGDDFVTVSDLDYLNAVKSKQSCTKRKLSKRKQTEDAANVYNKKIMYVNKPKVQQWTYKRVRPRILEDIAINVSQNTPIFAVSNVEMNTSFTSENNSFVATNSISNCSDNLNISSASSKIIDLTDDSDEGGSYIQISRKRPSLIKSEYDGPLKLTRSEFISNNINSTDIDNSDSNDTVIINRSSDEDNDTTILDTDEISNESNVPSFTSQINTCVTQSNTTNKEHLSISQSVKSNLLINKEANSSLANGCATSSKIDNLNYKKIPCTSEKVDNSPKKKKLKSQITAKTDVSENGTKVRCIKYLKEIFEYIKTENQLNLLPIKEVAMLQQFLKMDNINYQIFCYRLYTRIDKWYNVFDFCKTIKLDMSEKDISKMYEYLGSINFIQTDYKTENISVLLNLLRAPDIKEICVSSRMKTEKSSKEILIKKLLDNCNKQCTLSDQNMEHVLRQKVYKKLGLCIKITPALYYAFHHIYVLYCFPNSELRDVASLNLLMHRLDNTEIVLPSYDKDTTKLFQDRDEFKRFTKSYDCKTELLKALDTKNTANMFQLCELAYKEFLFIIHAGTVEDRPKFLLRFTPGAKYASALTIGAKHFSKQYPDHVCKWLKLLLGQKNYCQHKRGSWYDQLVMVQIYHKKNYEDGIQTLLEGLTDETISEFARHELSKRGTAIKKSNKIKLDKLDRDKISSLLESEVDDVPECEIDAKAKRSNTSGKKRMYEVHDSNGDIRFVSVEEIAIEHYKTSGYCGMHCENSLLSSLFFILFWDIIYEHKVEGAFLSNLQSVPLDLYCDDFYENRKEAINERLEEIADVWSDKELKSFATTIWDEHSHEKSLIVEGIVNGTKQLLQIISCIGRKSLSEMFKRLVKNFGLYHSGMPDLFLWNVREKKCKFVEVKGENDKLSINQKLWLDYLRNIDVDVEVCHVHSKGSKRRTVKAKKTSTGKKK